MKKKHWLETKNILTGDALKAYFLEHAIPIKNMKPGFYKVIKELKVFKKTGYYNKMDNYCDSVTALVIPVGAKIFAADRVWADGSFNDSYDRKMRASEAIVHSSWNKRNKKLSKATQSAYDSSFRYAEGRIVKPHYFDTNPYVCEGGIHFFLNFADAYKYNNL